MHTSNEFRIYSILVEDLLIEGGFIGLPEGAQYSAKETAKVLVHASTSSTNSIESAVNDLKIRYQGSEIPSADTVFNYIKPMHENNILSGFRRSNKRLIDTIGIRNTPQTIAIDFHNILYYGDKNTPGVRGIQPKNGTSWGFSFLTADCVGGINQTLDVIPVHGLNKDYKVLIKGTIGRIESMGIQIDKLLMDREFFNKNTHIALTEARKRYIMPAKIDKRMKRVISNYEKENGMKAGILKYRFLDVNSPTFYLVLIPNEKFDPNKKEDKNNKRFFAFATNIDYRTTQEFIASLPLEYRKRWNIETGYRMKNVFKIRTCSKSPIVRLFLFLLQCLMHNFLNVLKHILLITAYTLKSAIQQELNMSLNAGVEVVSHPSLADFYKKIKQYNELRLLELQIHLECIT